MLIGTFIKQELGTSKWKLILLISGCNLAFINKSVEKRLQEGMLPLGR